LKVRSSRRADFTFADIYLLPMLFYRKLLPEPGPLLAPSAIMRPHAARRSFIRTIPPRRAKAS
jgi:hypothetical protein